MKVNVKGHLRDLLAFKRMVPRRKKRIKKAPSTPMMADPINELARNLHPETMHLIIDGIKDETISTKTFRLTADSDSGTKSLAFFRAGQYLSIRTTVNGVSITRPYSIASSPRESLNGGFYEITIRKKEGGFLTEYIWNTWEEGDKIESSGPSGVFYYEDLRDTNDIVALAGGSGITPFRSMMKDMIDSETDVKLTLIYGTRKANDIIFEKDLRQLEEQSLGRFKVIIVCSEPYEKWEGPRGFLTKEIITECIGNTAGRTFFICGPPVMYEFLKKELEGFNLPRKRVRREAFGDIEAITTYDDFPTELVDKSFKITVHMGNTSYEIPARATESVLVAMERANLSPPSRCRSGECGFCRSLLLTGNIYVSTVCDGRRAADKKFNYFHPCYSYPISDLVIKVPRRV